MTPRDGRSVGELLLQADVTARGLLFEVTGDDAHALLRTFGEVVESAADLWRALPATGRDTAGHDGLMSQLEAITTSMHRAQVRRGWPGDGPSDPRLLTLAETFTRAADLVTRHRPPDAPAQPAAIRRDVHAARTRTMHALYVTAHAVAVAVTEHVRDVQAATAGQRLPERVTRDIPRGQEALARLGAFEQLAGTYVGSSLPTTLAGEHRDPYAGLDRLMTAVAGWDLAAHRALTKTPSAATVATIARGQAMASRTGQVLLHAAARTGTLDPDAYAARLAPALEDSLRAWSRLARQADALTHRGARRVDPGLLAADGEVQAATRELIHDGANLAAPEVIANRADLSTVGLVLSEAMSSGLELATAINDTIGQAGVTAPAQVMLTAARHGAFNLGPGELATLGDQFTPRDLVQNRDVPLIEPVHAALARTTTTTIDAMSAATSAVSGIAGTATHPGTNQAVPPMPSRHRPRQPGPAAPIPSPGLSR